MKTMLVVRLDTEAARTACMAGFHAAQALIFKMQAIAFERSDKIMETQKGVNATFYLQTGEDAAVDQDHCSFLVRSYRYKDAADYAVGIG